VRLFIGSGMPPGLWERVCERFSPAQVLEFYASTQGEAILINVTAAKPGAMGRPLPGSADVRIAAWDVEAGRLRTGDDGFAQRVSRGGRGMLLARCDPGTGFGNESALRGVFERDDAWAATGDLFRQDEDGDYWLVDPVTTLVRTRHGRVPGGPARAALGRVESVDLVATYGVPVAGGEFDALVAAITLRPDEELDVRAISRAVRRLPEAERPTLVGVIPEMPVTTWYRPMTGSLRAVGIPAASDDVLVWEAARERYKPLTDAARRRLEKTGSPDPASGKAASSSANGKPAPQAATGRATARRRSTT
jgi:putative long chain acyl-CoA synthase